MSQTAKPVMPLSLPEEHGRPVTLNPQGWPVPRGYANGMSARGRLVVTGGVVGWDVAGVFPAEFVDQARQCFENIRAILAEGGAEPHHVVRLTWYVTDVEEYQANLAASAAPIATSSASTTRPWPWCRWFGWWKKRRRSRSRRRRSWWSRSKGSASSSCPGLARASTT
jgi:enamine deaminase RidA (YjgF/YER057c/UK114 family)